MVKLNNKEKEMERTKRSLRNLEEKYASTLENIK